MRRDDNVFVGKPGEESEDYLLLGALDPSLCPCDECCNSKGTAPQ